MLPLDGYCGKGPIPAKFESCKRMLVKFVSDNTNAFKGFNASYSIKVTQGKRLFSIGRIAALAKGSVQIGWGLVKCV